MPIWPPLPEPQNTTRPKVIEGWSAKYVKFPHPAGMGVARSAIVRMLSPGELAAALAAVQRPSVTQSARDFHAVVDCDRGRPVTVEVIFILSPRGSERCVKW